MYKQATVISHRFNGHEDAPKAPEFVEIDGNKFVPDPTDPKKAKLGEDGKTPVPFVEKKPEDKGRLPANLEDLSKAELADLAKHNPALAKLLDDNRKREEDDKKRADDQKKKEEEDAKKSGKWQELAESREKEIVTTKETLAQKEEQLGKYVESTKKMLELVLSGVPKENLTLIPADYSPRQKLEYVLANLKQMGVKMSFDGKIPKSDKDDDGTEVGKAEARMKELTAKGANRTNAEAQELRQLGIKITQLKRDEAAAKATQK